MVNRYEVFSMDVIAEADGEWVENDRHKLGELSIVVPSDDAITPKRVLEALKEFQYCDIMGREQSCITTTDRRRVYAEDYYEDGSRWEIGMVRNHMPMFALVKI